MRKKKRMMAAAGAIVVLVFLFFKMDEIAWVTAKIKSVTVTPVVAKLYHLKNDVDLSGYEPSNISSAWTENNRLVMHAAGGVDGQTYLNCMEGLEWCVEQGCNAIEIDFTWTDYDKVVISHRLTSVPYGADLSEVQTNPECYEKFYNGKVCYKYTPIRPQELIAYMEDHPDVYIITDCKGNLTQIVAALYEMAKEQGCQDVMDRFVIQIYKEADYEEVKAIYPFTNWIFTLYEYPFEDLSWSRIIAFCLEHDIEVVTMQDDYAKESDLQEFQDMNIKVYVHTINSLYEVKRMFRKGVYGVYTDYLVKDDLRYIME